MKTGAEFFKLQKVIFNLSLEQFSDMLDEATKADTLGHWNDDDKEEMFQRMRHNMFAFIVTLESHIINSIFEYAEQKMIMYTLSNGEIKKW